MAKKGSFKLTEEQRAKLKERMNSPEVKERKRLAALGNKNATGNISRTGRKNSQKQIDAIKKANTGLERSIELKKQIQEKCKQYFIAHPEVKDKCVNAAETYRHSDEIKDQMSIDRQGLQKSTEHKANISASVKQYYKDNPEAYEKQVQHCLEIGPHTNRKPGWYAGIYCQSSWELAYIVYNLDHSIIFSRNKEGFAYTYQGVTRKYYPDFQECSLEDPLKTLTYIEIKGWEEEVDKVKWDTFRNVHKRPLRVLYDKDIVKYLNYVIEKYGENFTEALYEPKVKETEKDKS